MKNFSFSVAALAAAVLITSCSEHTHGPDDDHDHDVVTTLTFTLKPVGVEGDSLVYVWEDIDGIGGNNPNRIDTMALKAGVNYAVSVRVENRSKSPAEDVTSEIQGERDKHQFIYTLSADHGVVTVTDTDSRGLPVGLTFSLQASAAEMPAVGTFSAVLYHYSSATQKVAGVPGPETDISIVMPVRRFGN